MRLFFILFVIATSAAFAQQDTTRQLDSDRYREKLNEADSSLQQVNKKIDGVQSKVNGAFNPDLSVKSITRKANTKKEKKDSLRFSKDLEKQKKKVKAKIDSLESAGQSSEKYKQQLDSLGHVTYERKMAASLIDESKRKFNTSKQKLASKRDSLSGLSATGKYKSKLDSVTGIPMKEVTKAQSKVEGVEKKLNAPVDKVESTVNEKLSLMNKEGGAGANIPGSANLPGANVDTKLNLSQPDLKLENPIPELDNPLQGQLNGADELKEKMGDVKNLPGEQMEKIKSIDEVKGVQGQLGAANGLTDKAQAYSGDVKNITQGNLNEIKEAPKALEDQAAKMDGVQGIQKEAGAFNQYKEMAAIGNDQDAIKKMATKQAATVAKNHFAGKEEVLKVAMDKLSKMKLKQNELGSFNDITKRVVNEMNGKPFMERLVPGITLQVQKSTSVLVDYNPYLGFRISGKLTAGAGWNERVTIGKHVQFSLNDRIYGPRVYGDLKIGKKGFSVRTDIELMNTTIPSVGASSPAGDPGHRDWVWSAFIGFKKEYKFWGRVKGNAQFLYNLYDDHDNSPYTDRFAVRMGFEFPTKRKVKQK